MDRTRYHHTICQNKYPRNLPTDKKLIQLKKNENKKISLNVFDENNNVALTIESIENVLTKRIGTSNFSENSFIYKELDTYDQFKLIQSCQNKLKNNDLFLAQFLTVEIQDEYESNVKLISEKLNVKNYKHFAIPFEKNIEFINIFLNLQNYYIEKYDLKTLKKNSKN